MKAIIGGKRYDTETAEELAVAESHHNRNDFQWWKETLYKTKNGNYFIDGEGGALSSYAEPIGNNAHTGGGSIRVVTREEAFYWAEKHQLLDLMEHEFSDYLKDG